MPVFRRAGKSFFVALSILSMAAFAMAQSIAELRKQAESGNSKAQYELGLAYYNSKGIEKDDARAFDWTYKAAKQRLPSAETFLGVMYATGAGVAKSDLEAHRWWHKAALEGELEAEFNLGEACYGGQGIGKDKSWRPLGFSVQGSVPLFR
jgi:hypothetical protein